MRKEYEIYLDCQLTKYPENEKKYIKYYLDKITYKNDVDIDNTEDVALQCIAPIVTCVVREIVKRDNPFIDEYFNLLIRMINVENITKEFITYSSQFITIAHNYLSNLDSQAELTLLFCNNYVWGLVNILHQGNKNKIERMIKLKIINEEMF